MWVIVSGETRRNSLPCVGRVSRHSRTYEEGGLIWAETGKLSNIIEGGDDVFYSPSTIPSTNSRMGQTWRSPKRQAVRQSVRGGQSVCQSVSQTVGRQSVGRQSVGRAASKGSLALMVAGDLNVKRSWRATLRSR